MSRDIAISTKKINPVTIVNEDGDNITTNHGIITIDTPHQHIHDGNAFKSHLYIPVGAVDTLYYQFEIGTKEVHFQARSLLSSESDILFSVIENPTVTDGTIEVPIFNADRGSTTVSTSKFYSNSGTPTGGTEVDVQLLAATKQSSESVSSSVEWIYPPNNTYIVKIQNIGGKATNLLIRYFWYEED